jgi:hypothetical protein
MLLFVGPITLTCIPLKICVMLPVPTVDLNRSWQ